MTERIKRIYVDTSVIYGAPDQKFSQDSKRFWQSVRRGEVVIIVSDVLEEELKRAPAYVRSLFATLSESQMIRIVSTRESNRLAAQYIADNVVGESSIDDCRHIALATIAQADAIVSWNFQHIVDRRDGYNSVNLAQGYPEIKIQNPKQFMENNNDNT